MAWHAKVRGSRTAADVEMIRIIQGKGEGGVSRLFDTLKLDDQSRLKKNVYSM